MVRLLCFLELLFEFVCFDCFVVVEFVVEIVGWRMFECFVDIGIVVGFVVCFGCFVVVEFVFEIVGWRMFDRVMLFKLCIGLFC